MPYKLDEIKIVVDLVALKIKLIVWIAGRKLIWLFESLGTIETTGIHKTQFKVIIKNLFNNQNLT